MGFFLNNVIKDIMRTTHRREKDPEKPTNECFFFFTLRMFKTNVSKQTIKAYG